MPLSESVGDSHLEFYELGLQKKYRVQDKFVHARCSLWAIKSRDITSIRATPQLSYRWPEGVRPWCSSYILS